FSTCHRVLEVEEEARSVLIGKPITNSTAYILDERLNVAPVGVVGSLSVGGMGLARGYVKDAELTAERVIPHCSSEREGERLYRTGDLARRMEDGSIDFVGRSDHQVKVRGYRVELGEVEAALSRHPKIERCVVSTVAEVEGTRKLIGYYVGEELRAVE